MIRLRAICREGDAAEQERQEQEAWTT